MGRRGPRPLPTSIKRLRGTLQPCRANPHEPEPRPGRPEPPGFLDAAAREEWDRLLPELEVRGLVERTDLAVLTAYVTAWSQLAAAERALGLEGPVAIDLSGRVAVSAFAVLAEKARAQLIVASRELGLSPSARTSVKAGTPPRDPEREERRRHFFGDAGVGG